MIKIGDRFGRLVVIKEVERKSKYRRRFLCKCDCGNLHEVNYSNLQSGRVKSCGCFRKERVREHNEEMKERARQMGYRNRKYVGCLNCDCDIHYAKGYCRKCYTRLHRQGVIK